MRRFANINKVVRVAVASTAVIVAIVGMTLLLPSPSPSAMPRLDRSPTGSAAGPPRGTTLVVTEARVRFSLRVPADGWEFHKSEPVKRSPRGPISLNKSIVGPQGAEAIVYWTSFPDGDFADPCARLLGGSVGPGAAGLAAAVSQAPGVEVVKRPSRITVGGLPAMKVVLKVREAVGCNPGFFFTWGASMGGAFWMQTNVGDTIRMWIVDVRGNRLVIGAATTREGETLKSQITHIVRSIRFA